MKKTVFKMCTCHVQFIDRFMKFSCKCFSIITGCRSPMTCSPGLCSNEGVCADSWDSEPGCLCAEGYQGSHCQVRDFLDSILLSVFIVLLSCRVCLDLQYHPLVVGSFSKLSAKIAKMIVKE